MFSKIVLEVLFFITAETHCQTADALGELSDDHSIARTQAHRAAAIPAPVIVHLPDTVYALLVRLARRLAHTLVRWETANNPDIA